jgi:hypothetical protein
LPLSPNARTNARAGGLPHQVGIDEPAGDQEPVVLGRVGLVERQVDAHRAGRFVEVHPADPARVDGDHVNRRASQPHGGGGDNELDHLEPVGRQHRNSPTGERFVPVQLSYWVQQHGSAPLSFERAARRHCARPMEGATRMPRRWRVTVRTTDGA